MISIELYLVWFFITEYTMSTYEGVCFKKPEGNCLEIIISYFLVTILCYLFRTGKKAWSFFKPLNLKKSWILLCVWSNEHNQANRFISREICVIWWHPSIWSPATPVPWHCEEVTGMEGETLIDWNWFSVISSEWRTEMEMRL